MTDSPFGMPPRKPLFAAIPDDSAKILAEFDSLVQGVRPLSSRQMLMLPGNVRDLSHFLTDGRGERRAGYMNETVARSAYVRYYQWWNLVRLTRLLAGLGVDALPVSDGAVCLDIGSGPLTVPIALWLARPDLRRKKLRWYCVDTSQSVLALGEELFLAVAARTARSEGNAIEPWGIVRVKGELGTPLKSKADFVACANLFNEVVENSGKPPEHSAKRAADALGIYAEKAASVLVVEPGTPPSVRFLSALRGALLGKGWEPVAPCLHSDGCPMDGRRGGKWCHFVFSAQEEDVPQRLRKLSVSVGLPKERAALSFVLMARADAGGGFRGADSSIGGRLRVRVASDPIRLPGGRTGFYGCSRLGLALLASRRKDFFLASGEVVEVEAPARSVTDAKSGALLVELDSDGGHKSRRSRRNGGQSPGRSAQESARSSGNPVRSTAGAAGKKRRKAERGDWPSGGRNSAPT